MGKGRAFGHIVTQETREKISQKLKGRYIPNKGHFKKGHQGDSVFEEKRRQGLIGRKFSDKHKSKIGDANRKALKEYFKTHSHSSKGKHIPVPHLKSYQFKKGESGEKSKSWKGGRYKDTWGYIFIYAPEHPFAINGGYVREHRLVIEQVIGRYLTRDEVVHHINFIKDDNRVENLRLMTNIEHKRLHAKLRRFVSN